MIVTVKLEKITTGSFNYFRKFFKHYMEGLPYSINGFPRNETDVSHVPIIIRAEEALIVILVFVLWIAAIILFFNRWGKIRMLEPYQPKFNQQHRSSCPLLDPNIAQHHSFSKFNIAGDIYLNHQRLLRPRQNSVFVGPSVTTFPTKAPRKVKSAFDLQNLIYSESPIGKSTMKINFNADNLEIVGERKSSIRDSDFVKNQKREQQQLHCFLNKELIDNEILIRSKKNVEMKQRGRSISNQSSIIESRNNSITNSDLKALHSTKLDNTEKIFPYSQNFDLKDSRTETKNCRDNYRRNSILVINSVGIDRNLLSPRESIKSGVIDFRRNSMLIINNLTEDLGCNTLAKDYSLGGSHLVLGSDLYKSDRRNSLIPQSNYEGKQKIMCQPFAKSPNISGAKYNFFQPPESKYISSQKASKSLDCAESGKVVTGRNKKEISQPILSTETMQQLSVPTDFRRLEGSSASLNDDINSPKIESSEENTSSYNSDRIHKMKDNKYLKKCKIPLSHPRKFSAEAHISWTPQPTGSTSENQTISDTKKVKSRSPVSISTSLTNLSMVSATPSKILSSKDSFDKKNLFCSTHIK